MRVDRNGKGACKCERRAQLETKGAHAGIANRDYVCVLHCGFSMTDKHYNYSSYDRRFVDVYATKINDRRCQWHHAAKIVGSSGTLPSDDR